MQVFQPIIITVTIIKYQFSCLENYKIPFLYVILYQYSIYINAYINCTLNAYINMEFLRKGE